MGKGFTVPHPSLQVETNVLPPPPPASTESPSGSNPTLNLRFESADLKAWVPSQAT